ncbi:MAG: hypothetical protein N2D54_05960, partial [Chloroflexota bacterium]
MSRKFEKKQIPSPLDGLFSDLNEEDKLTSLFQGENQGNINWLWDADTHKNYTGCSPELQTVLGFKPADFVGKNMVTTQVNMDSQKVIDKALEGKSFPVTIRIYFIKDNNDQVEIALTIHNKLDEDGKLSGWQGSAEHILEVEKQAVPEDNALTPFLEELNLTLQEELVDVPPNTPGHGLFSTVIEAEDESFSESLEAHNIETKELSPLEILESTLDTPDVLPFVEENLQENVEDIKEELAKKDILEETPILESELSPVISEPIPPLMTDEEVEQQDDHFRPITHSDEPPNLEEEEPVIAEIEDQSDGQRALAETILVTQDADDEIAAPEQDTAHEKVTKELEKVDKSQEMVTKELDELAGKPKPTHTLDRSFITGSLPTIPPILNDEQKALMALIDDNPDKDWAADELLLITEVSNQLNLAIENAELFQQTQEALSETDVLYQASAELNRANTYRETLDTLQRYSIASSQASTLVGINLFTSAWSNASPPEWVDILHRNTRLPQGNLKNRFRIGELTSIINLLDHEKDQLVHIENFESNLDIANITRNTLQYALDAKSAIFIPMAVGGEWLGYFDVYFDAPTKFDAQALRQLTSLASQAAEKILSIQLNENEEARRKTADRLNRIAHQMAEILSEKELISLTIDLIFDRIQPDQVTLYKFDQEKNGL